MPETIYERAGAATDDYALDAYSQVVTRVAETLAPSVAALQMSHRARVGELSSSRRRTARSRHADEHA